MLISDRIVPKQVAASPTELHVSNLGVTACHALQHIFSFSVPTTEALDVVASLNSGGSSGESSGNSQGGATKIVEVGAGTAYWAMLLQDRGCEVVAYDIAPASTIGAGNAFHAGTWTSVLPGNGEHSVDDAAEGSEGSHCKGGSGDSRTGIFANGKHEDCVLLMSWFVAHKYKHAHAHTHTRMHAHTPILHLIYFAPRGLTLLKGNTSVSLPVCGPESVAVGPPFLLTWYLML